MQNVCVTAGTNTRKLSKFAWYSTPEGTPVSPCIYAYAMARFAKLRQPRSKSQKGSESQRILYLFMFF